MHEKEIIRGIAASEYIKGLEDAILKAFKELETCTKKHCGNNEWSQCNCGMWDALETIRYVKERI